MQIISINIVGAFILGRERVKKIQTILIYIVICLYVLISNIFLINRFTNNYYLWINPIFWFIIFVVCLILRKKYKRYKNKYNLIQKVIIIMLFYIIIYYLSGLIFGFEESPYSQNIIYLIKNIWQFISIIVFQEYIRNYFVSNLKSKREFVLITILFILANINYNTLFINFKNVNDAFRYLISYLIPLTFSNTLCTYLSSIGSYKLTLCYKIPLEIIYIISPIFPAINFLLTGFVGIVLPSIVYLFVYYDYQKSEQNLSREKLKKDNPFLLIPFLILAVLFICFVIGIFKYKPMAIMSNSMLGAYSRGDIIIYSKPNQKELENIELYNIIVYKVDNMIVAHRVINIEKNNKGEILYTTKGDNNNSEDSTKIKKEDIIGIVKIIIPYLGYPTVWLNELFG